MSRHMPRNLSRGAGAVLLAAALAACNRGPSEAEYVESARQMLAKKETKGAIIQLKNALQKKPDAPEVRLMLGRALLESGDPAGALVELRKAQELQVPDDQVVPPLAQAMLLVGDNDKLILQYGNFELKTPAAQAELRTALAAAYAVQGDTGKSRAATEDALRLAPGYAPALIMQSRLALSANDSKGALALLDQVLAAEPGNERAGIFKGDLLLRGGDTDGALAAYRKVLTAKPDAVAARAAVANLLFRQNKLPEARTELAELKKVAPANVEALYLEAMFAFSDKDYKRSRELIDQVLKTYPDNAQALELAGSAEYKLKNYLQAEALLARALKAAPGQTLTRLMLAQSYLRSGQPSKVVELMQADLEGKTPNGNALALAGEAYLQLGDAKRSEAAFKRALQVAPQDARVRTSAAIAQVVSGNGGAAIGELESVARGDESPRADLALVSARLSQKDLPGALKAVDNLEKKMPGQALPHHLRGRVMLLKKDTAAATKHFEAALAAEPGYYPAAASLAGLQLAAGKPEAARQRLETFLKANPRNWQAQLALAELGARGGATPAAIVASVREAVKINPSEPRPHQVLVGALMNSGDNKGALSAAQDAAAALPNSAEIQELLGTAELAAGDHQRAISTFKKLAAQQPRSPGPELKLAEAYMTAQDREQAARSLKRALDLQPELPQARRMLAQLAVVDKRPQEALTMAREQQKRKPDDPSGYALEGEVQAAGRNWDAAIAAFRAALQRDKANTDVATKLHATLLGAGRAADAERQAAEWMQAQPRDARFLYFLGDAALSRNDWAAAEARYRSVLELQPNNGLALNNVAWLLVKQGKPGAVPVAERANTLLPNRAAVLDTLATALEADNQIPKALETQQRAVSLEGRDPMLKLRLAKLLIKHGDKGQAKTELESLGKLGDKFGGQAEVASLLKTL